MEALGICCTIIAGFHAIADHFCTCAHKFMKFLKQMYAWTKYTNNNEVATELSRHEHSTSRTFIRLITCTYKRARQSRQRVIVIQSVLCEDTLRVKKTVMVWRSLPYRSNAKALLRRISKKQYCCCYWRIRCFCW